MPPKFKLSRFCANLFPLDRLRSLFGEWERDMAYWSMNAWLCPYWLWAWSVAECWVVFCELLVLFIGDDCCCVSAVYEW